MTPICKDIFKAIHEGKWLKIEYRNLDKEITNYWIGICDILMPQRMLKAKGMHLGSYNVTDLKVKIDSIISTCVIDGTFFGESEKLVEDISANPDKYRSLFDNVANLKILTYLELCNKLDNVPYATDYDLIQYLDRESFAKGIYSLSNQQLAEIVKSFSFAANRSANYSNNVHVKQLAINELSINTKKGLYVLAYRKLNLDVEHRTMVADRECTICTEFGIDGNKNQTIRKYLDADDYDLLVDFEKNQELIKNAIIRTNGSFVKVDDMPYLIGIGRNIVIDLHNEYKAIINMYEEGKVTYPIKAFFGDLLDKPIRRKAYPIALLDSKVNLDQLLAINKAMQYPTAYIQGPPGTGKTNTIINTIVTAFFNERTVLFASNNNHPMDSVFEKLSVITYGKNIVPFPVLRLGNYEKVKESLLYMKELLIRVKDIKIFDGTLDRRKDERSERAKKLITLFKKYEEYLDLIERKETIQRLIDYQDEGFTSAALFPFEIDLQGRQLEDIKKAIKERPIITEDDALALIDRNESEFLQYLFYTSAKYIKRLEEAKYADLREIILDTDVDNAVKSFAKYLSDSQNVKKLQRVFPIIITTCISAQKIGKPEPLFDMTIIDEASQCNTATSLLPIIRGENLMLVGDPQQLNPVILLDEFTNNRLKKEYKITDEYDYCKNSIYKVFLASDSVSDEILLHNHYRCNPKIIGFNNKKYYSSKLNIKSISKEDKPLVYVDVRNKQTSIKNTSESECKQIVEYVKANKDKNIAVITPFANQKELIENSLREEGISNVPCGTIHSFQGDEKDVVIFSTAIADNTQLGTYNWLKNNKELINVATSRAKDKLVVMADAKNVKRLHEMSPENDDLFELLDYVSKEGTTVVTPKENNSRALGIKPFSTETETAFLENLTHALENIWLTQAKYVIHKEVPISQVFADNVGCESLFYTGRFDFVVYQKENGVEIPALAIELDGKEHLEDEVVRKRDAQKNKICKEHNLQLIRVENTYARRYNYIKAILISYFKVKH